MDTHSMVKPLLYSIESQFFYFAKAACIFAGHAKCIQASDCCHVNEYCIAWKLYVNMNCRMTHFLSQINWTGLCLFPGPKKL